MNIVRGVADYLRKAPPPPPPAPGGDAAPTTSFPAGDFDDAPTPLVVFRYARENDRTLSFTFALQYLIHNATCLVRWPCGLGNPQCSSRLCEIRVNCWRNAVPLETHHQWFKAAVSHWGFVSVASLIIYIGS